ncbi:hypothetical protein D3C87_429870 [compost metagenome]
MRLLISLCLIHWCGFLTAQSTAWVENSGYFKNKSPHQIGTYLFEDGSYQLSEGNYRFKFNKQGVLNSELIQEVVETKADPEQKTSGCTAYDMKNNIRYTLADNIIHMESMFPDRKNEYRSIPLEKQEHVVKSVWDQYSNNSNHVDAGIITSISNKVILYQSYYAISANTHPGLFKPKGINTYLRLSMVDLKTYTVSYEYLLIDVFNPAFGKKKEVLDLFDFKCIGMNSRNELLFSVSKTAFKDRNAPLFSLSDYKLADQCKSGIDIWSVSLTDFSQKKIYSGTLESPPKATSVSFGFGNDGWQLTWTEQQENYFTFHSRSFQLDRDYDIKETVMHFPSREFRLEKPQTPNLRIFKDLKNQKMFCVAAPNASSIFVMDEQGQLTIIDNRQLEWDLNKHFVLSDSDLLCLPCIKDLSPDELSALSGLPEQITQSTPHTRTLKFRKVGNTVFYLHMESLNEPVGTGRLEKIRQLFLRSGQISL